MFDVEILSDRSVKCLGLEVAIAPLVVRPLEQLLLVPQQLAVDEAHHRGGISPHLTSQFLRFRGTTKPPGINYTLSEEAGSNIHHRHGGLWYFDAFPTLKPTNPANWKGPGSSFR